MIPPVLALAAVAACGVYLCGFGLLALVAPTRAGRFLLAFAQSPPAHYFELALRLLAGAGFIAGAPLLPGAVAWRAFGWALVLTTLALALLPWRWHQRFAARVVPQALAHLRSMGVVSVLVGAAVLAGVALRPA